MTAYDGAALTHEITSLIRARMARLGVTQAQLADQVQLSQSQLSKQLRGIRQLNIDELANICNALGLSLTDLFAEAQEYALAAYQREDEGEIDPA